MEESTKSINYIEIDKKVIIGYTKHDFKEDGGVINTENKPKTDAKPHPDFIKAFHQMKTHAIRICELTHFKNLDEHTLDRHKVLKISINESDGSTLMTIEIKKELENGKTIKISTPEISVYEDEYFEMAKLQEDYDILIKEAEAFLDGAKSGEKQLGIKFAA